ncbi:helix-turn-helix transcriptional regulator [Pontibacterium sp.]|uniref:helix-turn-helix transcriptional regulator n=1 Tax=Pontibacterium sp. TaxID=2036026 RepID=UPI003567FD89
MKQPDSTPMLEPLLKTEEAAAFLNISKSALEKGRAAGNDGLPPYCRIGRSAIRYRRSDLVNWVNDNVVH